jgi:hypothetical protein
MCPLRRDANFGIRTLAGLLLGKTRLDSVYGLNEPIVELGHYFGGVIRPISCDISGLRHRRMNKIVAF